MPPKLFYFDLGNVLLSFSHEQMCAQMARAAGISYDAVWEFLFGNRAAQSMQWRYEVGQLTTNEYFDFFCRATGTRPDRERLLEAVCDIFAPIDETWALVQRLATAGHRLAILSNTNPVQWQFVTDGRFPLLSAIGRPNGVFEWAILSYEARSMKPDRAIFEAAIERAGVAPHEVFFTDDRPENVEGARAVGIDAVPFINCDELTANLRARAIRWTDC